MGSNRDARLLEAEEELGRAVAKWLAVAASLPEDPDDPEEVMSPSPVLLGWVTIACYDSVELSALNATANAYACGSVQPAPFSEGLARYGARHWGG